MERREITIERNVIENAVMALKEFIKKNRRLVLFSLLGFLLAAALGTGGYIYFEHRANLELSKYESIMERYRALARAGTENPSGVFVIIEELKTLVKSSSWGFVHENGNYIIAGLYYNTGTYKEAREYFMKFAEANPRSEFAVLSIQKAAVAAEHLGLYDEALRAYKDMELKHGDTPYADQISYDLARMYQKKGDIYKAKEYYHKVITSHPRSVFSARARHRLFLLSYQEKNAK